MKRKPQKIVSIMVVLNLLSPMHYVHAEKGSPSFREPGYSDAKTGGYSAPCDSSSCLENRMNQAWKMSLEYLSSEGVKNAIVDVFESGGLRNVSTAYEIALDRLGRGFNFKNKGFASHDLDDGSINMNPSMAEPQTGGGGYSNLSDSPRYQMNDLLNVVSTFTHEFMHSVVHIANEKLPNAQQMNTRLQHALIYGCTTEGIFHPIGAPGQQATPIYSAVTVNSREILKEQLKETLGQWRGYQGNPIDNGTTVGSGGTTFGSGDICKPKESKTGLGLSAPVPGFMPGGGLRTGNSPFATGSNGGFGGGLRTGTNPFGTTSGGTTSGRTSGGTTSGGVNQHGASTGITRPVQQNESFNSDPVCEDPSYDTGTSTSSSTSTTTPAPAPAPAPFPGPSKPPGGGLVAYDGFACKPGQTQQQCDEDAKQENQSLARENTRTNQSVQDPIVSLMNSIYWGVYEGSSGGSSGGSSDGSSGGSSGGSSSGGTSDGSSGGSSSGGTSDGSSGGSSSGGSSSGGSSSGGSSSGGTTTGGTTTGGSSSGGSSSGGRTTGGSSSGGTTTGGTTTGGDSEDPCATECSEYCTNAECGGESPLAGVGGENSSRGGPTKVNSTSRDGGPNDPRGGDNQGRQSGGGNSNFTPYKPGSGGCYTQETRAGSANSIFRPNVAFGLVAPGSDPNGMNGRQGSNGVNPGFNPQGPSVSGLSKTDVTSPSKSLGTNLGASANQSGANLNIKTGSGSAPGGAPAPAPAPAPGAKAPVSAAPAAKAPASAAVAAPAAKAPASAAVAAPAAKAPAAAVAAPAAKAPAAAVAAPAAKAPASVAAPAAKAPASAAAPAAKAPASVAAPAVKAPASVAAPAVKAPASVAAPAAKAVPK